MIITWDENAFGVLARVSGEHGDDSTVKPVHRDLSTAAAPLRAWPKQR